MRTKLQKILLSLVIILLPVQLGLHFWPSWAYINGVRIDYFSPTLYLTDILVLALFLLEIPKLKFAKKYLLISCTVGLFALINTYFSYSPAVTVYKWLKVLELVFVAWYVARHKPDLKLLIIPIFYSCLLAVWQFINQGSIGGLWYFLGERTFNSNTPGIAAAVINGQLVLRPYATFSHPNALMGFLVVSGFLLLKHIPHISRKITALVFGLVILVLFLLPSRGDLLTGFNLRQQLNNLAVQQFSHSPLVGTGLGTSPLYPRNITNFALLHQPIHNIYLLLLSETGILGLGAFLILILKKFNWLLLPILFLGLFDHYFFTQQQTQLLLALIIGIIW